MATSKRKPYRNIDDPTQESFPTLYLPNGSPYRIGIQPHAAACGSNGACASSATRTSGDAELQRGSHVEAVSLDFAELPDGSLVELVKDSKNPTRIRFLVWNHESTTLQDTIDGGEQVFAPPKADPTLIRAVRFPTHTTPCGQPSELLEQIAGRLHDYVDLPDESLRLVANYVLGTWLVDCLPVAPYLSIFGPTGSGKTTLLKLLQCLCRRPLLLGDISGASLYRLISLLRPTLLIDESDFQNTARSRELQRLLRAGNTPGEFVARNGQLFDLYGCKVMASRQPLQDVALGTRAIHIAMSPSRKNLQPLHPISADLIAEELQPKLLMFRLLNYSRARTSEGLFRDVERFSPKVRDIARALAAPLLGNADLERELTMSLVPQDDDARLERFFEPEWLVVEVLFNLVHASPFLMILVGGIASEVNHLLAERGESQRFTARALGAVLKSIGMKTERVGRLGRGFRNSKLFERRVHELAKKFGITRAEIASWGFLDAGYGGPTCNLCSEFDLTGGLRLVEPLEGISPPKHRLRRPLFETELDQPGLPPTMAESRH